MAALPDQLSTEMDEEDEEMDRRSADHSNSPPTTDLDLAEDLEGLVSIDQNTIDALQIFREEWYPSAYKQGIAKKEALSLFAVFDRCVSRLGSREMKRVFLRPVRDRQLLSDRLDLVEFFANPDNLDFRTALKSSLKGIKSIKNIVERMRLTTSTTNDWTTLSESMYHAIVVGEHIQQRNRPHQLVDAVDLLYSTQVLDIVTSIHDVIDFEETRKWQQFQVKDKYDPVLDEMREKSKQLPDYMTSAATEECQRMGGLIPACHVTYIPQLGYLLEVPTQEEVIASGDIEKPSLTMAFATRSSVYYRSEVTRQLDANFGDYYCEITDRQMLIMNRLQEQVLSVAPILEKVLTFCARLDCYIAMAEVAQENRYQRPTFNDRNAIEIVNGRHPLQELCLDSSANFVPNSYQSGGRDAGRVKIITGPNSSGKSIYLKQVCLIVYLAHLGSFVPADAADLPIIDRLLTRIRTVESISGKASTFMSDLQQMSPALNKATSCSLVAVDEFGKGTLPEDGVALLAAIIRYWLNQSPSSPHLLVSTHFHSLSALLPQTGEISYHKFDVMRSAESGDIFYDYVLREGKANSSVAHHIAALAELPRPLVERGLEIAASLIESKRLEPNFSQLKADQLKANLDITAAFLRLNIDSIQDVYAFLHNINETK